MTVGKNLRLASGARQKVSRGRSRGHISSFMPCVVASEVHRYSRGGAGGGGGGGGAGGDGGILCGGCGVGRSQPLA